MIEITLNNQLCDRVLYYETGFEQLHPLPEIHCWMDQRGQTYQQDWHVKRVNHTMYQRSHYMLVINNDQIATEFVLRWL